LILIDPLANVILYNLGYFIGVEGREDLGKFEDFFVDHFVFCLKEIVVWSLIVELIIWEDCLEADVRSEGEV
jgi:hypothetical protein